MIRTSIEKAITVCEKITIALVIAICATTSVGVLVVLIRIAMTELGW